MAYRTKRPTRSRSKSAGSRTSARRPVARGRAGTAAKRASVGRSQTIKLVVAMEGMNRPAGYPAVVATPPKKVL